MAITRLGGANAITGTIPVANGGTGVTTADEIGNFVKVASASGTAQSGLSNIEISLPETYSKFKLYWNWKPETDNATLLAYLSTDNGSSYYTSSNNYKYGASIIFTNTDNQIDNDYSDGNTSIRISKEVGNNTANAEGNSITMDISPIITEGSVNQSNRITWWGTRMSNSNAIRTMLGTATLEATYVAK